MEWMRRRLESILVLVLALPVSFAAAKPQNEAPRTPDDSHFVPPAARQSVEIGNFYLKRKSYRGALSRFQEAIRTDPDYAPGYLGLGKAYEKLGLKQKALAAYQHYLDALPSQKQADEAKDVHKAMEHLRQELAASPARSAQRR